MSATRLARRLSARFGAATRISATGTVARHPDAIARTTTLLDAWECSDDGYHRTLDVRPLRSIPDVAQAEWLSQVNGRSYITAGYLLRVPSWEPGKVVLFHATSLEVVRAKRRELRRAKLRDHLPRIFARCRRVTVAMVRRLGWCEPGIKAWWSRHGKGSLVDSMPVAELFRVVAAIEPKDLYTQRLYDLLLANPDSAS